LEIPKNIINSLFPPLSNPSAILSIIDPEEALIWSRSVKSLGKGSFSVSH
jgi:hypothetical protein